MPKIVSCGDPNPTQPEGQSAGWPAFSLLLMKKYEKRSSLISVGRSVEVKAAMLWSAQAGCWVQFEGRVPAEFATATVVVEGPNACEPSCEYRRKK